jgi:hypothetical protein
LRAVLAELDDLPRALAEWPTWESWERAAFTLEWDHVLADYLPDLEEQHRSGAMSVRQEARYQQVLTRLKAAAPTIEQLELQLLDVAGKV